MSLNFKKSTIFLIVCFLGLSFFAIPNYVYASSNLPEAINGKITLIEDVSLTDKHVISDGKTLTIDLAGHTLQGPGDDYAIDNLGVLTIVDSASSKGKIVCRAASQSCIHNFNTMEIKGVMIDSQFIAVKSEPKCTLEIEDAVISAVTETGLLNAGNATVNTSYIKSKNASAVYISSGKRDTSNLDIKNSTLEGKYALKYDKSKKITKNLHIINVKLKGDVHSSLMLSLQNLTVKVDGNNEVSAGGVIFFTKYGENGAIIKLTENAKKTLNVPEGVTLIVPEGITLDVASTLTLNGNLDVNGTLKNANVYNKSSKVYYRSFSDALKKAKDGNNIVLQNNVSATGINTIANANITLDLNGKTFTGDITNVVDGTLTIKDSSDSKTGKVDGLITNNGILTIEGGKYTSAPVTEDDAKTTLTGGIYPAQNVTDANIPDNMELKDNKDGSYSLVYKDANYSAVKKALDKAKAINRSLYTEESLKKLDEAVLAVVEGKKIDEQEKVDAMAEAILTAINRLVVITNPHTADGIMIYVTLAIISSLIIATIYLNKKKLFNK